MTCDRCGLEVLEGEAFFNGQFGVTLHAAGTCIERLKAEAQRWREAHDKIIAYAADVEAKAKESIAEVAAENATLKNERDRLRKQLAEAKAQMEGEVWNLSQQNTALREALGEQVTEKMRQRMHDAAKREEALNHLAIENAALREDKARLVEALEEIADGDGCNCRVGPGCDWKCKDIARNALAKKARAKK